MVLQGTLMTTLIMGPLSIHHTAEVDFIPLASPTLSFVPTAADMEECVPVTIAPDTIIENDEFFIVRLTPDADAVNLAQETARVYIRDDDGKLTV